MKIRTHSRRFVRAALVGLVGCGGSAAETKQAERPKGEAEKILIGDIAARQGGLKSVGDRQTEPAATQGSLRAERITKEAPVKLDGALGEWPARTAAKQLVAGEASTDGLGFAVAIQYDDQRLIVGGDVTDMQLTRTARFAETEDHASLLLAIPAGGGFATYEVGLFAGKPGETTGSVRFVAGARKGQAVPGAKIVEAPGPSGGYTFEASIPWAVFPEARHVRVGLHAAVRYYDSNGAGGPKTVLATSAGDLANPATLPLLPTASEQALIEGLLSPRGLIAQSPKFDLLADVAGDGMKEHITVYDRIVAICGPHYRGGSEYFYRELESDIVKVEVREVTGRTKEDLVIRKRSDIESTQREYLEVWSFLASSDDPATTFQHEIAVASGQKHVGNAVRLGSKEIEVTYEPAVGWDPRSYQEPTSSDVEPVLLPWGGVKSQTFRFDGSRFVKAKEVSQAALAPPPPPVEKAGAPPRDLATARAQEPATPTVHTGEDLSRQLLDRYRHDQHASMTGKPRFDFTVNIDAEPTPERVVLVGRDLVVFGPGFKGGSAYTFLTLQPFDSPADIHDVTARDLTADGAAELIVRGARRVSAASGPRVEMDVMLVYQMRGDAVTRIFGIETARELRGKRVQGMVQFVPNAGAFEIDVRPGRAVGWTEKSYPWAQEQPGSGSLEPLLLPWGKVQSLRYSFNGTQFAAN